MSDGEELAGCMAALMGATILATLMVFAAMLLMSLGSVYGAAAALRNYYLALRNNVEPERVGA